ncbi:AAA family ATPase [Alkalibacillus sp. S2W]|uniref:AAA family ATPase n=1 Tax=Alkalibacillus sp. S2W TaxID=3386553 RepID=UPI00398CC0C1
MKPLTLTLTAFGPYREREVIDFQQLKHHRLFVVSGKTGAGKTTIFDGISYALYGTASGEDRDHEQSLRSDFANDQLHTSVDLTFEIGGERYRVYRQMPHVKEGNKTATGGRHELYHLTEDGEVPYVDRQKKSDVDEQIKAIVGLTQDQFRQIVMLPQGEFRKLLTSDTENKEAILRRIFNTIPYQELSEQLKEKREEAKKENEHALKMRDHYVHAILNKLPERDSHLFHVLNQDYYNINQVIAGLNEERKHYVELVNQLEQEKQRLNTEFEKQTDHIQQAKTTQEESKNLEQKSTRLNQLLEREDEMQHKERSLQQAERAAQIEPYEQQYRDIKQELTNQQRTVESLTQKQEQADQHLNQATTLYQQEKAKETTRQEIHVEFTRLKDIHPKVQALHEQETKLDQMKIDLKNAEKQSHNLNKQYDEQFEALQSKRKQVEHLEQAVENYLSLVEQRQTKREQYQLVRDYAKQSQEKQALVQSIQEQKRLYEHSKAEYDALQNHWLNSQASVLASHLHDDEACPVCGSVDHPDKQTATIDAPSDEKLEQTRQKMDQVYGKLNQLEGQKESIESNLKSLEHQVIESGETVKDINQTRQRIEREGQKLKEQVEQKDKQNQDLKQLRQDVKLVEDHLNTLRHQKEKQNEAHQKLTADVQSEERTYHNLLNDIPEEVRQLSQLEEKLAQLEAEQNQLQKDWENAQKAYEQAQEQKTTIDTQLNEARHQLNQLEDKQTRLHSEFESKRQEAGFTNVEDYEKAKLTTEKREQMKQEIEQYRQEVSVLKEQVEELKQRLEGKQLEDIETLEQQLQAVKNAYEQTLNNYNTHMRQLETIDELINNLKENQETIAEKEKQLGQFTDLHDLIRGHNEQRLSFERYLQIDYLNQIIEAANMRLRHLSNGQFYLVRSQRQEARGRQSGLGLDVFDAYTGQERDVKTMSGGEKFNASLCLALGMSDVIQSYQGGISIETMFIDEGFGSLDDESLNKAIDTLIDLQQSGRMIGVISHVDALKSAIPAVLEVSKTMDGYSQTQFIVD